MAGRQFPHLRGGTVGLYRGNGSPEWSLLVVRHLSQGSRRFTELKRGIDGISQRMLTVTLRALERDGVLTRTVRNVMPPHVSWSTTHLARIDAARAEYDRRADATS